MLRSSWLTALIAGAVLVLTGGARAETKVTLKGVHLCCGGCVTGVGNAVKATGAKAACDKDAGTVTITAKDDGEAQKALDALATAGYHGESDNKDVKIKEDSGAEKGKVKTLNLVGAHNCCGACCKGIKETLKKVDGVKGDTAKPKARDFSVTGDFDAAELVKALNAAGYHVKVKKE
jgi:copper chaperone CopZ